MGIEDLRRAKWMIKSQINWFMNSKILCTFFCCFFFSWNFIGVSHAKLHSSILWMANMLNMYLHPIQNLNIIIRWKIDQSHIQFYGVPNIREKMSATFFLSLFWWRDEFDVRMATVFIRIFERFERKLKMYRKSTHIFVVNQSKKTVHRKKNGSTLWIA